MTTQQIAVRLPRGLLRQLDDLVERGLYDNRAAAVRAGIEVITQLDRRNALDAAILTGYRHLPPMPAETGAALASLREAILEEPW
jgi:Arc/MetJ-type ribon-helix-helix transcriptional regulator